MYEGKLVFSQLMDHLPQHTFRRCVERFAAIARQELQLSRAVSLHASRS